MSVRVHWAVWGLSVVECVLLLFQRGRGSLRFEVWGLLVDLLLLRRSALYLLFLFRLAIILFVFYSLEFSTLKSLLQILSQLWRVLSTLKWLKLRYETNRWSWTLDQILFLISFLSPSHSDWLILIRDTNTRLLFFEVNPCHRRLRLLNSLFIWLDLLSRNILVLLS